MLALAAVFVATAGPVSAAGAPVVQGSGFMRVPDAKAKITLSIEASDAGVLGDQGTAKFLNRKQGQQGTPVEITLSCVNVLENTAMASGMGNDGNVYLLMVRDNADGSDSSRDEIGVLGTPGAAAYCASGVIPVPSAFRMGTIDRGDFVVAP